MDQSFTNMKEHTPITKRYVRKNFLNLTKFVEKY